MKPIRTEEAYKAALVEIDSLMNAKANTPEMDRLEVLGILVEAYEQEHYSIPLPDPISAINYYMETREITRSEFCREIGVSNGRLSEILLKQRGLSKELIRRIEKATKIPATVLLQPYELVGKLEKLAA